MATLRREPIAHIGGRQCVQVQKDEKSIVWKMIGKGGMGSPGRRYLYVPSFEDGKYLEFQK